MAVDLLLITWNRSHYLDKMLPVLLSNPENFNIYWWDNGSVGRTRELFDTTADPRIKKKYASPKNVGQLEPTKWFLRESESDIVGKIDDDILMPDGWIGRLVEVIESDTSFGMVGGWVFREGEWDQALADKNSCSINKIKILRCVGIQGHTFLCRKNLLIKYGNESTLGLPVDQPLMTIDGIVNGYLIPPIFLENMDDPRSQHYMHRVDGGFSPDSAFTARKFGFKSIHEYSAWIADDAKKKLELPFDLALKMVILNRDRSIFARIIRRLFKFHPIFLTFYRLKLFKSM